jgi:3-oxoacyl-[acyl-carrier-protein] synthase II
MAAIHDKFGRPVVVVTGSGLVTPLGAGKADRSTADFPRRSASIA